MAKSKAQPGAAGLPPGGRAVDDTPAMRQYHRFKQQHPDCVLFFRIGDFYEMFHDDAKLANRVLGVTLTQRTEGIPMAGVPYHAVESYLRRMIRAGYRVAVCDQVEDAALAKGIVKRDITRVVTPGTLTDEALLDDSKPNPLLAVVFLDDQHVAAAWAELSTGSFWVARFTAAELADEVARIGPCELLYVESADRQAPPRIKVIAEIARCAVTPRPAWQFRQQEAIETLGKQFQVATLAGFGLADDDPTLGPASAVVHYLLETQRTASDPRIVGVSDEATKRRSDEGAEPETRNPKLETAGAAARHLAHLQPPRCFRRDEHLIVDPTSLRSLEVETTMRGGESAGSLLGTLLAGGDCATAMGKRMLRYWLCYPLGRRAPIEQRQRVVGALVEDGRFRDGVREVLSDVQDVPRLVGRLSVGRGTPRDLVALGRSASKVTALVELLRDRPAVKELFDRLAAVAAPVAETGAQIAAACVDTPPGHLREGGLFRDGADAALDECRTLQRDSNLWLAGYQKQLIDETGIQSLKVGFNKIFGFYIELTAAHKDKAPTGWARKQTLKNAERFITQELKEYEGKVLSAEQRGVAREQELFLQFCGLIGQQVKPLQVLGETAAELDVLAGFARRAIRRRYVRPDIVDEPVLHIVAGRHPVLDELLGDRFVPNDTELGPRAMGQGPSSGEGPGAEGQGPSGEGAEGNGAGSSLGPWPLAHGPTLALITGPNMAGKSTYIRQAALIALLAHTGSFVPAEAATVGLCDGIFTRVGASDELHAGRSTFMVEMTETANICHHATARSLVILDEIGRGTSTLDGLSLAWAIAEYLAGKGARTLFATHYHELTALAQSLPNVTNLHVTVREWADQIVFLHRIAAGGTDRSYGIHVAKIAGLPAEVVRRANEVLGELKLSHSPDGAGGGTGSLSARTAGGKGLRGGKGAAARREQLSLFTEYLDHPAVEELRKADLTRLTPLEAFDLLRQLKEKVEPPQR